jgi:hypothetical protein
MFLALGIGAAFVAGCGGGSEVSFNPPTTTGSTTGTTTGSTTGGGSTAGSWISPMAGSTSGGTSVYIRYTGTVSGVTFGSTSATSVQQTLIADVYKVGAPAGSGTVDVTVNDSGQSVVIGTFAYVTNATAATPLISAPSMPSVTPVGLGVDSNGNVLLCDSTQANIDKVNSIGFAVGTLFHNSALAGAKAFAVSGADAVMIADSGNNVLQVNGAGTTSTTIYSGSGSPFNTGVNGIAISNLTSTTFNYYVATSSGVVDKFGTTISSRAATRIAVDASGNVYTLTGSTPAVVETTPSGTLVRSFGAYTAGGGALQFHGPGEIAVDSSGHIFVLDGGNGRIEKLATDGTLLASYPTTAVSSTPSIHGMTVGTDGSLYVVNSIAGTIEVIRNA